MTTAGCDARPISRRRLADADLASIAYQDQIMIKIGALVTAVFLGVVGTTQARVECEIADAKLEEAIQQNPRLRGPANSQAVRDLRSLRDAALTSDPMGVMRIVSVFSQIFGN
jgi:hypothetical protein